MKWMGGWNLDDLEMCSEELKHEIVLVINEEADRIRKASER